jgi:hypothetical protein
MVVPLHIFAWKMGCCLACGEVRLFATKTWIFGTYPMYFDDFPIQIPPVFADFRVFEVIMKRVSSCPFEKKTLSTVPPTHTDPANSYQIWYCKFPTQKKKTRIETTIVGHTMVNNIQVHPNRDIS